MQIEPMTGQHCAAVLAIYQAGIDEGTAAFETHAPGWQEFTAARLPRHRFVAIAAEGVLGWVAASAVSERCVYAGVIEHSVYVHPGARGQGAGRRLIDALITSTEAAGIWTIQSGSFPGSTASPALQQAAGFPCRRHPRANRPASRSMARCPAHRTPEPGRVAAPGTVAACLAMMRCC